MDLLQGRDDVVEMLEHIVEIDRFGARRFEWVRENVEVVDNIGARGGIDVDTDSAAVFRRSATKVENQFSDRSARAIPTDRSRPDSSDR